ncbi:hypothetical protein CJA_2016 [Cellvibrio japonicus Ueda107]|uniref:Uncharacterized protein n=1 Tax=Cellvibrio japonicus (strain Ueda107) TaxID=498211 RepID=B3PHL5_CELJU|nr:hypothetical protein CJA_2016 [Cellvibrio japonicus Ueda107]
MRLVGLGDWDMIRPHFMATTVFLLVPSCLGVVALLGFYRRQETQSLAKTDLARQ